MSVNQTGTSANKFLGYRLYKAARACEFDYSYVMAASVSFLCGSHQPINYSESYLNEIKMGFSDFLEIVKEAIDGQFTFKTIASILLALALFFIYTALPT